jgi:hypothetical protein
LTGGPPIERERARPTTIDIAPWPPPLQGGSFSGQGCQRAH